MTSIGSSLLWEIVGTGNDCPDEEELYHMVLVLKGVLWG